MKRFLFITTLFATFISGNAQIGRRFPSERKEITDLWVLMEQRSGFNRQCCQQITGAWISASFLFRMNGWRELIKT